MKSNHTITICGAGIAGIATAFYLLKHNKDIEVFLIDKNQPMSFTTSKSGENFRDYWPQKNMRNFVSDSILLMKDLRKEYGNDSFDMIHSGYNFVSHDSANPIFGASFQKNAIAYLEEITAPNDIQTKHPYLDKGIKKVLKIKNAGNIDVYALGSLMLREAKKMGLKQVEGEILAIDNEDSRFKISLDSKKTMTTDKVVIAAGPFINHIAKMLGFQFPITNTLQSKFIIPDPKNIIPKDMPFTIYADSQFLDWSKEEVQFFAAEEKYKWLLNRFPGGLHIKPDSGGIKLGWAFQTKNVVPEWTTSSPDLFPQVVLKGASRFIPKLAEYENDIPTPLIAYAGYYTRTNENWPLIGPTKMKNVFVIGALAGYGTMSACAAAKLCSGYISGSSELPNYAKYFHPLRYQNDAIIKEMNEIKMDGQL